ncbi:uncharacterized protein I303_108280 [Kwoniella dejecticola CBS 10117]|uniref:Uncharacterized protein n=1 Tax=Kwoniella dejecticola CBS 10117 TaxID=1296121 RepID=A0A1A5ZXU2_9TREE|nr:uncharacterized protein I303_07393 [Kwoniella dejecticola CBS 10117]OBR82631.1 hypothetical protein I303_07393 [Kwoniella dejecticola CBS 10117]
MTLPHNGSTAPAITSPELAWPSRPIARPSPLSTPSTSSFSHDYPSSYPSRQASSSTALSTSPSDVVRRSSSIKGKEKASNFELHIEDEEDVKARNYGPPKRPLHPNQLGRIAQSFGIIIPSLPQAASGPHSTNLARRPISPASNPNSPSIAPKGRLSPLPSHSKSPTRPSPFLLSVIPPLCLLPPSKEGQTPDTLHRRHKKWRRGKLLPLQPTLGSMLVCIAREYGLPSTVGIGVYLVLPGQAPRDESSSSADSSYSESNDDPNGPQISSSTWSTLFSAHLMNSAPAIGGVSRSSTPSQTPMKSGLYTVDTSLSMEYPLSPLSMIRSSTSQPSSSQKQRMKRSKSTEPPELSHSSDVSISSMGIPPTPASLGNFTNGSQPTVSPNPIVGTIEFDIDQDDAEWFSNYQSSRSRNANGVKGRHKKIASEGGIKELSLVNKVSDGRPRFLKELEVNILPDKSLEVEEEEEVELDRDLLQPNELAQPDLLASPIELAPEEKVEIQMDQSTRLKVQEILDKRGSGIVMAEQLEDLEKMMRQLSPREIRLTSPRLLTPRMASKVANLALPAVPRRSADKLPTASSPLAGGFTSPNLDVNDEEPSQPNSARSNGTFGSAIHLNMPSSTEIHDQIEQTKTEVQPQSEDLVKPVWPAVKHGSPGSPTIYEYFARPSFPTTVPRQQAQRNVSSPASISTETLQRMKAEEELAAAETVTAKSQEWIPRRPQRPPSPNLNHQRTLPHTLSPEMVDYLHRSPPSTGMSPGVTSPEEKKRNRSGSISLKGLRNQMSAKNLSQMFHSNPTEAASPPLPNEGKETIGLFRSGLPSETDFGIGMRGGLGGGMRSVSSPMPMPNSAGSMNGHTDFGPAVNAQPPLQPEESAPVTNSLNRGSGGKSKFKLWGFGSSREKHLEKEKEKDRSSTTTSSSRRNPSVDASSIKISDPIVETFVHKDSFDHPHPHPISQAQGQSQSGLGHGRIPSVPAIPAIPSSPNPNVNPASPRSVRRKPVPGSEDDFDTMKNSVSLHSMASFVLEDAPKGRRAMNGMMGQAQ